MAGYSEQAAEAITWLLDNGYSDIVIRALSERGILPNAPLREEWGTRFEGGNSVFPGKDKHYPFFFEGDPPKGENVRRYVTDWEKA